MTPALDVAKYLAASGAGVFAGTGSEQWSINAFLEPPSPDKTITVYDTGGAGPDTDEMDWQRPAFQVRVRCKVYKDGYAKQQAVRDLLLLVAPIVMETSTFIGINMTTDILSIGRDDNNRFLLTANYVGIRKEN